MRGRGKKGVLVRLANYRFCQETSRTPIPSPIVSNFRFGVKRIPPAYINDFLDTSKTGSIASCLLFNASGMRSFTFFRYFRTVYEPCYRRKKTRWGFEELPDRFASQPFSCSEACRAFHFLR